MFSAQEMGRRIDCRSMGISRDATAEQRLKKPQEHVEVSTACTSSKMVLGGVSISSDLSACLHFPAFMFYQDRFFQYCGFQFLRISLHRSDLYCFQYITSTSAACCAQRTVPCLTGEGLEPSDEEKRQEVVQVR